MSHHTKADHALSPSQHHSLSGKSVANLLTLALCSLLYAGSALAGSTLVSSTTTTYTYDNYGNPTEITVAVTDGLDTYTTHTNNTYTNNTAQWHLGRLTRAEVTQYLPGNLDPKDGTCTLSTPATCATRVSAFGYSSVTGLLNQEIVEPDTPSLMLVTDYQYDVYGNKTSVTVSGGSGTTAIVPRSTSSTYDARGQYALSSTNALGHSETRVYDDRFGVMLSLTGPNNLTTNWTYDSFGRQTGELRADGTQTTVTRQWCDGFNGEVGNTQCPTGGALSLTTVTDGAPVSVAYSDALGRVIQTETQGFDGTAILAVTEYDALGRVNKKSRPYFAGTPAVDIKWHSFTFDPVGRPLSETSPDGSIATTTYAGLTTSITNDKGQTNTRIKNVRGELIQVVDANNVIADYRYDAFGNLVEVEDGVSNFTNNNYDIRGRKISMSDPDMGYWTYQYNALGELTAQTDAKNQTVTMSYDLLGRLVARTELEGTSTWTYDIASQGIGKLASVSGAEGKDEAYTYDSLGRPDATTTSIDGLTYSSGQNYDAFGRLATVFYPASHHYPLGFEVSNVYNSYGYLQKVTDGIIDYWEADSLNASGQLTHQTLGNGITTQHIYDNATGLLKAIGTSTTLGTYNVQDLSFTFDTLGNLTQRQDIKQGLTEDFLYDVLNRMTSSTLDDGTTQTTKTYSYDPTGNILSKTGIGSYTYGISAGPHAVTSINTGVATRSFSYDANGNQTQSYNFTTNQTRTISYNSYNKPQQIEQGLSTLMFSYGANREQFKQSVGSASGSYTRTYVNGLFEKEVKGTLTTYIHHIKAGGQTIAQYKSKSDGNQNTQYLHRDHLGSITAVSDENAQIIEEFSYDPHGKRRQTSNWQDAISQISAVNIKHAFTGHEYLDEVGLIHMGGRVYDPDLGRFLSPDPFVQQVANPQSLNRYSYVLNNPLSFTDPSGFFFKSLFKAVVGGLVSAFKGVVKTVAKIVEFAYTNPIVQSIRTIAAGIACGPQCAAASAAFNTAINGGSIGDIIKSAGITYAQGVTFDYVGTNFPGPVENVVAHGVVGGTFSEVQGGDFLSGFVSGGFGAIASNNLHTGDFAFDLATSTVAGGIGAELGGGKFKNGAITGAFGHLFNYCNHGDCTSFGEQFAYDYLPGYKAGTCISNGFSGCSGWEVLDGVSIGFGAVGKIFQGFVGVAKGGLSTFSSASEFGIKSYKSLQKLTKGTGLEAHHLIEKRFAKMLGVNPGEMVSVALTKAEHQSFTNAWRKLSHMDKARRMRPSAKL